MQGHAFETKEKDLRVPLWVPDLQGDAARCQASAVFVPSSTAWRDDAEPQVLPCSSWPEELQVRTIRAERSCPSGGDEKSWACLVKQKRG